MSLQRSSGILLHPSSFPAPDGIGDLGPSAYAWIDFLHESAVSYWQILPLGPTGYGDSPYQCFSAFAGNPLLVSPLLLVEDGLLSLSELKDRPSFPADHVNFGPVITWKNILLNRAFVHFHALHSGPLLADFASFCKQEEDWLEDYGFFMAIKETQGGRPWSAWPRELKFHQKSALQKAKMQLAGAIEKQKFFQFLFFRQWQALSNYAHNKGVQLIGDMPFVVSLDSADVWARPELFLMDADLNPAMVAGVPPDYFSATGQLWGNPLYNWPQHQKEDFAWWRRRLAAVLATVDYVRIDHFRGFSAAWHVPFGNENAIHGEWIPTPGHELFNSMRQHYPSLPIIAEDLGLITPEVLQLREAFGLPGMKILQFGFGGDPADPFLPHNYPVNCCAYTGSHDNDTVRGWYQHAPAHEQDFCRRYLHCNGEQIAWDMLRAVWASVAVFAAAPLQDFLSLDSSARMNLPGSTSGNWGWRYTAGSLSPSLSQQIRELNFLYSRIAG